MKIIGFDADSNRVFFESLTGAQFSVKVGDTINDIVAEEASAELSPPCVKCERPERFGGSNGQESLPPAGKA